MMINPEQQHDENQQTAIWPEEVSNEGHVYVALGVSQQEMDTRMQRDVESARQDGRYE